MAQRGHVDTALSLEVHAKVVERKRDTGERIDALLRGSADAVAVPAPVIGDALGDLSPLSE